MLQGEATKMNGSNFIDGLLNSNWELALAAVIVVFAWIVGTRCFGGRIFIRQFPRVAAGAELILAPLTAIVIGSLARVLLGKFGITGVDDKIRTLTAVAVYLIFFWCMARVIEVWILSKSRDGIVTSLPGLQRSLLYAFFLLIGLFIFVTVEGYSITGVYVSTGAVAALIAFAMQRTLGDLFSGIALSIESPFRLGDWIALNDGAEGQVIDINWRATRLRGWDNATYVIPNGELARQGFKNLHGSGHLFAPWYEIKIPAEVDPRFIKALLLEAVLRCDKVIRHPLPVVRLLDASTVPYTYMVWVHFSNYPAMFAGREQLYREIHYALNRAGIQIAPEIHEIHTRRAEIAKAEPPTTLLALKGLDIANSLTDEELEKLAAMSQRFVFDAGTILIREGAIAGAFDIIINGIVESSITLSQGSRKIVDRLSPGQYFGITSMITSSPSVLQFTALTDVTIIRIDISCLQSLLADRPDLSEAFAKIVKQRLDRAEEVRLAAKKPASRLSFQDIVRRIDASLREPKRR
jgi:small-conductance mechanosensitive channel/CRP-like cAMP-binding protein